MGQEAVTAPCLPAFNAFGSDAVLCQFTQPQFTVLGPGFVSCLQEVGQYCISSSLVLTGDPRTLEIRSGFIAFPSEIGVVGLPVRGEADSCGYLEHDSVHIWRP